MSTSGTSAQSARLIISIFAAFALTVFVNARAAWAQDAADSGAGDDANWVKVEPTEAAGPTIDEDAASAEKVLEIPQAKCSGDDDDSDACNGAAPAGSDSSDNDQSINAPSPGAPPQTYDEDAYNQPDADWGNVDEYQNQQAYSVPYVVVYPYPTGVIRPVRRPSQTPPSTFTPMSSPLTQAARPPLNQGPWMTPPTMSAFSRPAGGPMVMSAPLAGFHR
jgi:hypothetical protein